MVHQEAPGFDFDKAPAPPGRGVSGHFQVEPGFSNSANQLEAWYSVGSIMMAIFILKYEQEPSYP